MRCGLGWEARFSGKRDDFLLRSRSESRPMQREVAPPRRQECRRRPDSERDQAAPGRRIPPGLSTREATPISQARTPGISRNLCLVDVFPRPQGAQGAHFPGMSILRRLRGLISAFSLLRGILF
jgi:hypothetical protein